MYTHGNNPAGYWFISFVCVVLAGYTLWKFFGYLRRDRFAADTPTARIRSAAQGYVHMEGVVRADKDGELRSPLTRRHCVWWEFKVEHRSQIGGRNAWHLKDHGSSVNPFVLDDGSGTCLVGTVSAEIIPSVHNVWYGSAETPDIPPASSVTPLFSSNAPYRYTERLLVAGTHVTVLGDLRAHSIAAEVDEEVGKLVSAWKDDQKSLLSKFDLDKDGQLLGSEWEAVRAEALKQVEARLGSRDRREFTVSKPEKGRPFIIAPMDTQRFVRREKLRAVLSLAAALALTAFAAWSAHKALHLPWPVNYG